MFFLHATLLTSGKEHQIIITHNTNQHCRIHFYACVGQPVLKQLYIIQTISQSKTPKTVPSISE